MQVTAVLEQNTLFYCSFVVVLLHMCKFHYVHNIAAAYQFFILNTDCLCVASLYSTYCINAGGGTLYDTKVTSKTNKADSDS